MNKEKTSLWKECSPNQVIIFFVFSFVLIYSVLSIFLFQSVLPDSAQNLSWGHSLRFSYNRHPPLGTWLLYFAHWVWKQNELAAFSASTLCLSTSLIFVYCLAKNYMAAREAAIATLLSSLSLFYLCNFVLQFNQNTIMLPFWVMVAYFSDKCFRDNRSLDWLLLGISSAAAMLAKYESLLIIGLAFLYLLTHFHKKYLYKLLMAFALFLLLLTPHIYSLTKTGFLTLDFIHTSMHLEEAPSWLSPHVYFPLQALFEQIGHLLPEILIFIGLAVYMGLKKIDCQAKAAFNYLIYLGIAPFCLVLLISMLLKIKIQGEWGYPLYAFSLPAILSYYHLEIKQSQLFPLLIFVILLHIFSLLLYKYSNYYSSKPHRTNNPSYELAEMAKAYWQRYSNQAIRFVGGDEYIDYYLAAYLPGKPLLLENYSIKTSPWINEAELKQQGLLMLMYGCDQKKNETLKQQFHASHYKCMGIPLSNKSSPGFMKLTLMIIPPRSAKRLSPSGQPSTALQAPSPHAGDEGKKKEAL